MDMKVEDPRLTALLLIERYRIQRLGHPAYLLELQELADAAGAPLDQILVPFQDILSGGPAAFTGLSPSQAARSDDPVIHLLNSGHVCPMRAIQGVTVLFAIEFYKGNVLQTARRLHMGRKTLERWLKNLRVSPQEIRERHKAESRKRK